MPIYQIHARDIDFLQYSVILDTNVLVAAFYKDDNNHEFARFFIDESDYQLLIPAAVIIETWGMLVGSRRNWTAGYEFLSWINTPGKPVILLPQQGEFTKENELVKLLSDIDCVDALIANITNDIADKCSLDKAIAIATYDTRDYYRLKFQGNLKLNIFDMRNGMLQELD